MLKMRRVLSAAERSNGLLGSGECGRFIKTRQPRDVSKSE